MSTVDFELPLFPLSSVLFPGGPLHLRIFEPRYVDMVKRCMREGSCFGVVLLQGGDLCVTDIVAALGEKLTTVSQRLKLLRTEGLVSRRREGNHIYYGLRDTNALDMIRNAMARAKELTGHSHEKDD